MLTKKDSKANRILRQIARDLQIPHGKRKQFYRAVKNISSEEIHELIYGENEKPVNSKETH